MSADMKACPFCGGTDLYWPHGTDPAIIQCGGNGCGARSGVPEEQDEDEAIALWNRRTDLTPPAADYVAAVNEWAQADAEIHKPFPSPSERVHAADRLINARAALHALAARPASPDVTQDVQTRTVSVAQLEAWEADAKAFRLPTTLTEIRAIIGGQDRG